MGIEDILRDAQTRHVRGQFAGAEERYREVLASDPSSVGALEGLGVLVFQQGRAAEAVQLFGRGVALRPQSARLQANLGEAFRTVNQLDKARDHLNTAAALDPALAQTWNSLGLLAADERRPAEAESSFREAIRLNPTLMGARVNLANTFQNLGRLDEAIALLRVVIEAEPRNVLAATNLGQMLCEARPKNLALAENLCRRAVQLAPNLASAWNGLGKVLRLKGLFEEAIACHERALQANPRDSAPHHHLGQLLAEQGRLDEASRQFVAGRAKNPRDPRFHVNLGELLSAGSRFTEARPHYQAALACDPASALAHHGLGRVLLEEGRLDEAESAFRQALGCDPTYARSWSSIARLQAERGDLELSCQSARTALSISPDLAEAYWRLAVNLKGRLDVADEQGLERLIQDPGQPAVSRTHLHFSLATVRDHHGRYAEAATLFDKAHAIQSAWRTSRGQIYDHERQSRFIDSMIAAFPAGRFDQARPRGDAAGRPVFIVGLPRSGTTLLEQILASHPAVWGAGELPHLHDVFQGQLQSIGRPTATFVEALESLDQTAFETMARRYTESVAALAPDGAARIVDKMHDNIRLLGLIGLMLPGARVILCERDLRDVAVSCRQAAFTANIWTDDWQNIARRFAGYQRIVAHWRLVRPIEWLEVSYEECVNDLEREARRMIDFLGLDWDPACLDFARTRRVVKTASLAQVREPIHDRSVGRWRRYEAWHEPMFQAFKMHGVEFDEQG
jgi:tetratricopeptide (TPR) repeat protein